MSKSLTRLIWAAVAAACLTSPVLGQTAPTLSSEEGAPVRDITPDDIVRLEAFGRGSISPDGRWALYEKRGAYDTIARFDFTQRSVWSIMDLWVVDLHRPGAPPERLLPGEGPGLLRVAWSPSGARLLVHRLRDGRFEAGVVTLADRSVVWTGLTPEIPGYGISAAWVSDGQVVVMARPDGSLPPLLRINSEAHDRTTAAWARSALGREPVRTVIDTEGGVARPETPEADRALVLVDLARAEQRILAQGAVTDFELSPDRRRLAIVAGGEPLPMAPGRILQAESPRRQRLSLLDLASGRRTVPAPGLDVAPHLLRWSEASRAVLVWGRPDGRDWTEGDLIAVTEAGVAVLPRGDRTPGAGEDILRGVRADWLGETAILYARGPEDDRFDWSLLSAGTAPRILTADLGAAPPVFAGTGEDGTRLLTADGALWRLDAGGLQRLTRDGGPVREVRVGDAEAVKRLQVDTPARAWAPLLGPDGESLIADDAGRLRRLGAGDGTVPGTLAVGMDAALVLERTGLKETLSLRTAGATRALDAVNAAFEDVGLAEVRPVAHLDARGRPTHSALLLPRRTPPGGLRGLVVMIYPGSVETGYWSGPTTLTYGLRAELLAGAGFAVLSPPLETDAPPLERGDAWVRSVDRSVDAALAAWPGLPADRIAVFGHSYGGYAALEIAVRSDRYQAYVASSSISDLFGEWGEFTPASRTIPEDGLAMRNQQGWAESGQSGLGASPWEDPQAYVATSPFLHADGVKAPLLLLTADRDYVPMSQAERMFSALHRLGGRARLVTYWGEHHAAWSPANIRDRYGQIFRFLDEVFAASAGSGTSRPGGPGVRASGPAAAPTPAPSPHRPPPPGSSNTGRATAAPPG